MDGRTETMIILAACRRFLAYTGLTTDKYVKFGHIPIPTVLIRFAFISLLFGNVIMETMLCVRLYSHGIRAILGPLHLASASLVNVFVYISLMGKSSTTVEMMDFLVKIVDNREFLDQYISTYIFPNFGWV